MRVGVVTRLALDTVKIIQARAVDVSKRREVCEFKKC